MGVAVNTTRVTLDAAVLGDGIAARRIDEYGFRRAASLELIAECGSGERKILIEHRAASLDGDDRHEQACAPEPTSAKVPTAGRRALPGWLAGADRLLDRTAFGGRVAHLLQPCVELGDDGRGEGVRLFQLGDIGRGDALLFTDDDVRRLKSRVNHVEIIKTE